MGFFIFQALFSQLLKFNRNCDGKGPFVTIIRVGKDTQVSHAVSVMINIVLSQATQAQAASQLC